ncbi:MAG TPA: hypothetical protein VHC22_16230 [Pirellulales bacterium]|nr:hypothetical protein [Pirellulales bacterium]
MQERYWLDRILLSHDPSSVRIEGVQYMLRPENETFHGFRGHDGQEFYIEFDDGRLVRTTNLWRNGNIPAEFSERLPDNAAFLTKEKFDQLSREPMKEHQQATDSAQEHAHKLEAVYRVHGREGLKQFPGEDVTFLYWCLQHEMREINQKIESGRGMEFDLLIKEQLGRELTDLRAELGERHAKLERSAEIER